MKLPSHSAPSRRDFLRQLSLGTAAVAAGIALPHPLMAQVAGGGAGSSGLAGRRKLGVALLGLGRYATNQLAPALLQTKNCRLTGVITGHPEKGVAWARQYQLDPKNIYHYDDMDRLADNPDIDIVYVVTPPALHPEFTIRSAKAGKHVLSEKPMATSVADCDAMIGACKKAGVMLSVGYRLHFDPYLIELMRLQREKDFGDFMTMTSARGFVMTSHVWRIEKKLAGGGAMMDLGIYDIQAACMATGLTPVTVTAKERPKERPDFFTETEETMDYELEFPNGATMKAWSSFNLEADNFRAEGAKGWIDFPAHAFSYKVGTVVTSRGPLHYPAPCQQALHMDDFADCILTGRQTAVPGEMGKRDIKIITAVYEAARTGQKVSV